MTGLPKENAVINFAQGLDQKTDPKQVTPGRFLKLVNSVFDKGGLLQKRNGYLELETLSDSQASYVTVFNDNLVALGSSISAYSAPTNSWINKGFIQPAKLSTLPLIRNSTNQTFCDAAYHSSGLVCTTYTDQIPNGSGGVVPSYRYAIVDSTTGQNIVPPTPIPVTSGAVAGSARVFILGSYFIMVFTNLISATNHLQYVAINAYNPTSVSINTDISATYVPSTTLSFDAAVANNALFIAWAGSGSTVKVTKLSSTLVLSATVSYASQVATLMSVTVDQMPPSSSLPHIWVSYYDSSSNNGNAFCIDTNLATIPGSGPTQVTTGSVIKNLTSTASGGVATIIYEHPLTYASPFPYATSQVYYNMITEAGTVIGTATGIARSVGLASKAFLCNGVTYMLVVYVSANQPTYFLVDLDGNVITKFAYENAGSGYLATGLPNATVIGDDIKIPYLIKDLVASATNITNGANTAAIYTQSGVNLVDIELNGTTNAVAEIGNNLNISGGFIWAYDGYQAVEQGFFLYPDSIGATASSTGGTIDGGTSANNYYYSVTYEWTDNQGNTHKSAPSIPINIDLTSGTFASNTNAISIYVPTLRLTYKTTSPVRIVVYRWSVGQEVYHQVTSVTIPVQNDESIDYITVFDTMPDPEISGNNILYTTGGVIENIAASAVDSLTLFQSRLWAISSEDKNLLLFSKPIVESTPVEMSDLLTIYVAPSVGAQTTGTGPMTAISAMDDKLIIFKQNAIYYINGQGPDSTGANSQYSDPVFITSTVGCISQASIVFIPQGLMFQSGKGVWLLGRDLQTTYIGAPVEDFNGYLVESAINVPNTNQVRFTLSNGSTLMYDYFWGQWGDFEGIPGISSTIYNSLHTFLNAQGGIMQETPGLYLDGAKPVLMSFQTGWMKLSGLTGYQRAYEFIFLGDYISPHKLQIGIAYDFAPISQQTVVTPDNYNGPYGSDPLYGDGSPYGGKPKLENWRIFFTQQRCQSFQLNFQEQFDATIGVAAGAGLTLSGINMVYGRKKGYRPFAASHSTS